MNERLVIHRPGEGRARLIERGELEQLWSGRLILTARRASLVGLPDVFDLRCRDRHDDDASKQNQH